MVMTASQRKANQKYDRANNTVISVKATKIHALQFKQACKAQGTTPNKVLHDCMIDFISTYYNPADPQE